MRKAVGGKGDARNYVTRSSHPHAVCNTESSVVNWPLRRYCFVICCSTLISRECSPNVIRRYVCRAGTSFIFLCFGKVALSSKLVWYSRAYWMSLLAQRPYSWFLSFPPEKCLYSPSHRPKLFRRSVTLPFVQCYSFITSQHFRSYFFRLQVHRIGQKMYTIHLNMTAETTSETWWLFNKIGITFSILNLKMSVICDPTEHIFRLIPRAWRWKEKKLPKQSRYLSKVQNLNQNVVKKVQIQYKQLLPILS